MELDGQSFYTNVVKHGFNYWVDKQEIKGREKWKKFIKH